MNKVSPISTIAETGCNRVVINHNRILSDDKSVISCAVIFNADAWVKLDEALKPRFQTINKDGHFISASIFEQTTFTDCGWIIFILPRDYPEKNLLMAIAEINDDRELEICLNCMTLEDFKDRLEESNQPLPLELVRSSDEHTAVLVPFLNHWAEYPVRYRFIGNEFPDDINLQEFNINDLIPKRPEFKVVLP